MSYEWIRRRKRYLSFRYLFPEFVAPWIQMKRGLLRVMWFFTHPVDEFFDDLGELIAWPFVAFATGCVWVLEGIREFFKDLFWGVESFFNYLGRLPVWTGAAIAGTLGIIMTILLFFLQVASFDPVPLSTAAASTQLQVVEPVALMSRPDPAPVTGDAHFDPFAGQQPAAAPVWSPTIPQPASIGLALTVDRLSLPPGWDARQRISVVSQASPVRPDQAWTHFERLNAASGWSLTRIERARRLLNFTPYVSRAGVRATQIAPSWVTTAASVSPYLPVDNRREPSVSITRTVPVSAAVGESLHYELLVSNFGEEPLDSVTVHEAVSAIDRVMDVDPPANVIDNTLVWNVTNLQPREQRRISIELRPDQLVPVSGGSTVRVKTGVAAVSYVSPPSQPAPPITPEPAPNLNTFVPQPQFESQTLPPSLARPEPAVQPEPPPQNIGMILPSFDDEPAPQAEPRSPSAEPSFTFDPVPQQTEPEPSFEPLPARRPKPAPAIMPLLPEDPQPAVISQSPPREQRSEATRDSNGVPIFFEMRTPTLTTIDQSVAAVFEIRNPGQAELTNLVILVEVTEELNHQRGRILEHRVERLPPGGVYRTRLTTTAVRNGLARVRSRLTSAENLESTLEAEIEVAPPQKPATELSAADLPPQGRPTFTQ